MPLASGRCWLAEIFTLPIPDNAAWRFDVSMYKMDKPVWTITSFSCHCSAVKLISKGIARETNPAIAGRGVSSTSHGRNTFTNQNICVGVEAVEID